MNDSFRYGGVTLKAFEIENISDLYLDSLNDKGYVRYSQQRLKTHTHETCEKYVRTQAEANTPFLAAEVDGDHVGNIGISINRYDGVANVSIFVFKPYAGTGYGKKIFGAAIKYAEEHCKCRKVEAGTMATNKAMIALMKSAGMLPDGVRKLHFKIDEDFVDCVYYARFVNA